MSCFREIFQRKVKLNLGADVLKIDADPSKLQSLSTLQPEDLYSSLQQHILNLQIGRRIAAFIERKQGEINENNVREFCNVINCNQENSCARTDAVFTPYPGFRSHVKDMETSMAISPASMTYTLTELDGKINALKATLLKKVNESLPMETDELPL
ncbi:UNVERIFIED_CONTAM: hypothetical protein FKN15_077226 [Acipenser sinensis]